MGDKTWNITLVASVTTMGGWEPDESDIYGWLGNGDLELVSVESVKEAT